MPLTVRGLAEALQVGENLARKILPRLPGAQLVDGIGNAKRWEAPDEAIGHVTEQLIEEARRESAQPAPAKAADADPRVWDLAREVAEEEARAKIAEARRRRLEAEAQLDRVERAHEDRRDRGDVLTVKDLVPLLTREARPDSMTDALRRELEDVRRRLDQAQAKPTDWTAVAASFGPLVQPILQRLIAPPTLATPPIGLGDILTALKSMRGLAGASSDFAQMKDIFSQAVELGVIKSEAVAEGGAPAGESSWWAPLVEAGTRFLNNIAAHPASAQIALGVLQKLAAAGTGAPGNAPATPPGPAPIPGAPQTAAVPPGPGPAASSTPTPGEAATAPPTEGAGVAPGAEAGEPPLVVTFVRDALRTIGSAASDEEAQAECREAAQAPAGE